MKGFYNFLVAVIWLFATIGSAGYLFYYGVPQFGIASLLLSAEAFPYVKKKVKELLGK